MQQPADDFSPEEDKCCEREAGRPAHQGRDIRVFAPVAAAGVVAWRDQVTQLAAGLRDGLQGADAHRGRACADGVHVGLQGSAAT